MADNQAIPSTPQTEKDSDNNAAYPNSNAISEMKIPPSHKCYVQACNKKRDKWDIAKLIAEFIGLAFLIIYTLYTAGIYSANRDAATSTQNTFKQIQQQTTLMRHQLVGTQGAVIVFGGPSWNPTTQVLNGALQNKGGLTGMIVRFAATIQRKTLPKQEAIGEPITIDIKNREVAPNNGVFDWKITPSWNLPEVKDLQHWPGNEVVVMEGYYAYTNGFGDTFSHKFCYLWIAPWTLLTPSGSPFAASGNQWSGGEQGCPTMEDKKAELAAMRKHMEETGIPHAKP